jgi:hypothetical protein
MRGMHGLCWQLTGLNPVCNLALLCAALLCAVLLCAVLITTLMFTYTMMYFE